MLQNAFLLAKIGADKAENEQHLRWMRCAARNTVAMEDAADRRTPGLASAKYRATTGESVFALKTSAAFETLSYPSQFSSSLKLFFEKNASALRSAKLRSS